MTELQERPNSGFVPIVQRIASAYPLHILSALRSLLDPALIEQIIEAGKSRSNSINSINSENDHF